MKFSEKKVQFVEKVENKDLEEFVNKTVRHYLIDQSLLSKINRSLTGVRINVGAEIVVLTNMTNIAEFIRHLYFVIKSNKELMKDKNEEDIFEYIDLKLKMLETVNMELPNAAKSFVDVFSRDIIEESLINTPKKIEIFIDGERVNKLNYNKQSVINTCTDVIKFIIGNSLNNCNVITSYTDNYKVTYKLQDYETGQKYLVVQIS